MIFGSGSFLSACSQQPLACVGYSSPDGAPPLRPLHKTIPRLVGTLILTIEIHNSRQVQKRAPTSGAICMTLLTCPVFVGRDDLSSEACRTKARNRVERLANPRAIGNLSHRREPPDCPKNPRLRPMRVRWIHTLNCPRWNIWLIIHRQDDASFQLD